MEDVATFHRGQPDAVVGVVPHTWTLRLRDWSRGLPICSIKSASDGEDACGHLLLASQ